MKNPLLKIILVVCVTFIVFSGNATAKTDITDQLTIKRVPFGNNISIASVKVSQDGDTLIVSGKLKLNKHSLKKFDGHVDVTIISPEGKSIISTSLNYSPRVRSIKSLRKLYRKTTFKACFSEKLRKGSTVRVALHNSDDRVIGEAFNCGNNQAKLK